MSRQLNMDSLYGDKIVSFGEPHLACALLLDVSGSMYGESINSLNEGIARFKQQVCSDPIAVNRVDIAIITFSDVVRVVSDFVPISQMPVNELTAWGETKMAEGIDVAIDLVKDRTKMYTNLGTPCHKPWIFMITDGASTSPTSAMASVAQRIREEESKGSHGRLFFCALGLGNYDKKELFSLTNRVMELKTQNFNGIFNWLSESMSVISQSRVGERTEFTALPEDVKIADWYYN